MKYLPIPLVLSLLLGLSACYYDNEQDLYPVVDPPACDTVNVSYSAFVQPLFQNSCYKCHDAGTVFGNINLENFTQVQSLAQSGRLYGSLSHDPAYSAMPQGENKLSSCNLAKIKGWIDAGALNN